MRATARNIGWLGTVGLCLAVGAIAFGCGSDTEVTQPDPGTDGGDTDVSVDGTAGTAGSAGGAADAKPEVKVDCELNGVSCLDHGDCCSANCDPDTKTCANPPGLCKQPGEACVAGPECCSVVCQLGVCSSGECTSDNKPCGDNSECCSGKCGSTLDAGGATCVPLNPSCSTVGNECAQHTDCCSKFCYNAKCSGQPSFCTQLGEACLKDFECCTGICNIVTGENVGLCTMPQTPGVPGCLPAGSVCGAGAADAGTAFSDAGVPLCGGDCCSRSCAPYAPTGVLICQPPSGCRPTGEVCQNDTDCCGGPGLLGGNGSVKCSRTEGESVGRCNNGNACRGSGAICKPEGFSCNAENNCCTGNVNQVPSACKQDLLGIPRCAFAGECDPDAAVYQGQPCASSADCCGLSCVPNPNPVDGGSPFVCGDGKCVPAGGACTTDADCCPGLPCVLEPGSTHGVCGNTPDGGVPEGGVPDAGPLPDGAIPEASIPEAGCATYGQTCNTTADCCSGVPCTQGRCLYPVY
jgi:hypothetical protein